MTESPLDEMRRQRDRFHKLWQEERQERLRLDRWAARMPDAGFTDTDPRWQWWQERPQVGVGMTALNDWTDDAKNRGVAPDLRITSPEIAAAHKRLVLRTWAVANGLDPDDLESDIARRAQQLKDEIWGSLVFTPSQASRFVDPATGKATAPLAPEAPPKSPESLPVGGKE